MSSIPPPTNEETQAQPGTSAQGPQGPQLPPTGLQQQLNSLQAMYSQVQGLPQGIGFNPQQAQFAQSQMQGGSGGVGLPQPGVQGATSLNALASKLAQNYGLNIGRGQLVDEEGNFLMTPEQLANASGGAETMGTAAAKMNMIASAIANRQTQEAQGRAVESLQAGMGLVQSRARGSLQALQSGMYSQMANLYANQEYEAADFSYYIQREQQMIEQRLQHRARKAAKRSARIGGAMNIIGGIIGAPFTGGMSLGMTAQGIGQAASGWV